MRAKDKLKRVFRPSPSHQHIEKHLLSNLFSTLLTRFDPFTTRSFNITNNSLSSYTFRQGRDVTDLEFIRQHLNPRLYPHGPRFHGPPWTSLLLGDEYVPTLPKKHTHLLHFLTSYCLCLTCRITAAKSDRGLDDMDQLLFDAQHGNPPIEHQTQLQDTHPVPDLAQNSKPHHISTAAENSTLHNFPHHLDFQLIGDRLESHELELGTVSKISANNARVTFSSFAKQFFLSPEYCGPLSPAQVISIVSERAKEHYKAHKGKTERRFYVHGSLNRFMLEGISLMIFPPVHNKKPKDVVSQGVIFRRQMMSVAIGHLALEDSFGSFLHTDNSFYIGFGQDPSGAQSLLSDGRLGPPRHVGVNELLFHTDFDGKEVEVLLQ